MSLIFEYIFICCYLTFVYFKQIIIFFYNLKYNSDKNAQKPLESNREVVLILDDCEDYDSKETTVDTIKELPYFIDQKEVHEVIESILNIQTESNYKPYFRHCFMNDTVLNSLRKNCYLRVRHGSKGSVKFFNSLYISKHKIDPLEKDLPIQIWHYLEVLEYRNKKNLKFIFEDPDLEIAQYLVRMCYGNKLPELGSIDSSTIFAAIKKYFTLNPDKLIPVDLQEDILMTYLTDSSTFIGRVQHLTYALKKDRSSFLMQLLRVVRTAFVQDIEQNSRLLPNVIHELGLILYGNTDAGRKADIVFEVVCELMKREWDYIPKFMLRYTEICL